MQIDPETYPESYAAFFAPRTHKFETVDFRTPTTLHNLRTYFPTSTRERINNARFAGLVGILIGLIMAIIGFAVDQLTRGLTIALYTLSSRALTRFFWPAFVAFTLLSLVYVLIAALSVVYIAPLGAGSGIPELKAYLNGVRVPGFLSVHSLVVKAVGVAFSISSGLICGKQGPMIHAGAIVGAAVSQAASSTFRWRVQIRSFRFLRTEAWKRDFTAVGAAVGVAVAFGSPMGAWMWVYEEACTHWSWELGIITLTACLCGSALVRVLNHLASGLPDGGFGAFTLTQFGKLVTPFDGTAFPLKDVPAFVLIGVLGGVAGAVLPLLNKWITLFRYKRITKPVPRLLETVLITFLTAGIKIIVPFIASDCRPIDNKFVDVLSNAPLRDYSRFNCPEGEFSPWAAAIYSPTDSVVRGLLFHAEDTVFLAGPLVVALGFYFIFVVWTYGIAVPAGVFFPGFLLGGVYGRLVGVIVQAIFPSRDDISVTGYAFVGAVSALAGLTRTISVAVIALEATGGNDASFATVLVALIAKLVGDFLHSKGIYDLHIDLKGMPYLSNLVPNLEQYTQVTVSEMMENCIVGVRRRSRVSGLLSMLRTNEHHAFPVFVKVGGQLPTSQSTSADKVMEKKSEAITAKDADEVTSVSANVSKTTITTRSIEEDGDTDIAEESLLQKPHMSSIITPTIVGMQATIFDEGKKRVVWLPGRTEGWIESAMSDESSDTAKLKTLSAKAASSKSVVREIGSGSNTRLDYQLMGSIDRGTLLVLLKHKCDKREQEESGQEVSEVSREQLDAAWPNPARLKGDAEEQLLQRVSEMRILDETIDFKNFIDPDPVLISDRAPSFTAYRLFRRTGARHILVANMRSGRICGILTRKDILADSVGEVLEKRNDLANVKAD